MTDHHIHYTVVQGRSDNGALFAEEEAARLAGLSLAMVRQCYLDGLVRPATRADGSLAFDAAGVRRLSRIARLQADLELDLSVVEIVLHLHDQTREMQRQMDVLRRQHQQREDELLTTIHELRRRYAVDSSWWE